MNGSLHQLALLKETQLLRQHTLGNAGDGAFKLRESPDRAREEPVQNNDLPLALSNSKGVALRSEDSAISSVTNKSVRIPIAHPILSLRSVSRISEVFGFDTGG